MAKNDFLYQKTYEQVKEKILNNEYPKGTRLPSEQEMKETYGVSIITLKKALEMLAEKEYIRRVPGKGTFVLKNESGSQKRPAGSGGNHLIGVILEHVSTPYGLAMMYQMDRVADAAGYKLCIRFSYGNRAKETEEIHYLLGQNVQGLIVMPSHGEHYNPILLKLSIEGFPLILVDKKMKGIPVASVRTNNVDAMAQLVKQAARDGCKNIVLVTTDDSDATSIEERKRGYKQQVQQCGLTTVAQYTMPQNRRDLTVDLPAQEEIDDIVLFFKKLDREFDAVFCMEYALVPLVVSAFAALGVAGSRAGRLYSIDEDHLAPGGYTFTHMKQDELAIGKLTVELLLESIQGKELEQEDYLVPATLQVAKGAQSKKQ